MDLILPIIGQILDFILQYLYVSQCNFDVFTFEGISICGKFEEFIRFFTKLFQFIFTVFIIVGIDEHRWKFKLETKGKRNEGLF